MNGVIAGGLAADLLLAILVRDEFPIFSTLLLAAVCIGALGIALILAGRTTLGARLVIASAVPFVPLGLIANLGRRQGARRQGDRGVRGAAEQPMKTND